MQSYKRLILIFTAIALSLILVLVLLNIPREVQIAAVIPAEDKQTGIYGPIGIEFSQSMDQASVESHFSLSPAVEGTFEWDGDTLWFYPASPLDPDQTYQLALSAGAQSENGRELLETQQWTLTIRSPDILYLVLANHGGDLWLWDATQRTSRVLTTTAGQIIDYAPSQTGEWIVYAAENEEGGADLWQINREGTENTLLLSCGLDYCSQPCWSPDGKWIAYARQVYNTDSGRLQASRVWTVNVETGNTTSLYEDEEALGEMPSFSPDGQRLASYDMVLDGIRVLNLETGQEVIIPTSQEEMGDWSADGSRLLYLDLLPSALEPEVMLYIADLENETIQQAVADDISGTNFSQPQWSPSGDWIAVSLRPTNTTVNKALWVLSLDGSEALAVANAPSASYSAYQWDPWGNYLVYQQFSASLETSIWIWDFETGETEQLIENGARPQWLP